MICSAEYFFLEPNVELVNNAAAITGGGLAPEVSVLYDPEGQKVKFQKPLWEWFLWPALFLIMLDVLFRRVRFYGKMNVPWQKVAGR